MSENTLKEVHRNWGFCSDFIKKSLVNRYHAIQSISGSSDWFEYLADEFGLLKQGRNQHQSN